MKQAFTLSVIDMILPAETHEFLPAPAKHRINTKASESTVLPAVEKDPFGRQLFVYRVSCHGQERPSWISSHQSWHIRVERITCGELYEERLYTTVQFRLRSAFEPSHTNQISLFDRRCLKLKNRQKQIIPFFRRELSLSLSLFLISRWRYGSSDGANILTIQILKCITNQRNSVIRVS